MTFFCRKSTLLTATLEEGLSVKNVSHSFEIENMGPSDIDDAEVVVSIPTLVWLPNHLNQTALINMSTLTIEVVSVNPFDRLVCDGSNNNVFIF